MGTALVFDAFTWLLCAIELLELERERGLNVIVPGFELVSQISKRRL